MADVHVLQPGLRVVAARAHLVVGDRAHGHVIAVEAGCGHMPLVDVDEVLEEPAVGLGAVGVPGDVVVPPPVCRIGPMPWRSTGARSTKRWGGMISHTCGGSTTWSSTLTIFGILLIGRSNLTIRQKTTRPVGGRDSRMRVTVRATDRRDGDIRGCCRWRLSELLELGTMEAVLRPGDPDQPAVVRLLSALDAEIRARYDGQVRA